MALARSIKRHSLQEYYHLEERDSYKSEFYQGEIFAMAGGSPRHSLVCMNLVGELRQRLKGKRCTPYEGNLRLKIEQTGLVTYPDASVFCEPLEIDPQDPSKQTAINPTVVFEVLSKSTEAYDRGKKAENYRQVASLKAYLLLSQAEPHVEIYEKHGDGFWFLREFNGLEAVVEIPCLGLTLPLAELYDRVVFGEQGD